MSVEWSEFARRLGRELASLERDTILIVREHDESRHYVQAMREPDRLYAEAVSNNFLEGPLLLTLADEEVMSEAGWRPPADPAPRNWWTELPGYATAADHDRLADVMVTALRDVQGVRRPSDLVYESFHRHGNGLIELLDFGIDTADPSRVQKRRRSAPDQAAPRPEAPALAAPVPEPEPVSEPDTLEPRLADAKSRGDHTTYFDLLLSADLVLPATGPAVEDPGLAEFPTTMIGGGTYVVVFTSPQALVRSGHRPGLYRRTSFNRLTTAWPDPSWQLAINPGLPSEVHLDPSAVARLDATQRALAPPAPTPPGVQPSTQNGPAPAADPTLPGVQPSAQNGPEPAPPPVPAMADLPAPAPPSVPAADATPDHDDEVAGDPAPGIPLHPPHGTRLWQWDGEGDEDAAAVPAAVFDAIAGVWTPVRADAVQAPRTD